MTCEGSNLFFFLSHSANILGYCFDNFSKDLKNLVSVIFTSLKVLVSIC